MTRWRVVTGSIVVALALASCGSNVPPSQSDNLEVYQALLSGANTVPPTATNATGTANFTFDGSTISYTLEAADIPDLNLSHIHSGAPGINGPIRVSLYPGPTVAVTTRRVVAQGTFGPADVKGYSFAELLAEMRGGTAYVVLHAAIQGPGGVGWVRGQIQRIR